MDKTKLHRILEFNKNHAKEILNARTVFYEAIGRQTPAVISDMQTMAQMIFAKSGYKFLRIPMESKEIGAFLLRLNNSDYLVLNTSKSLVNNNFSVAHELYHILIQREMGAGKMGELYLDNYEEMETECMANAFAGAILMPTEDIRLTSNYILRKGGFSEEEKARFPYIDELLTVFALMSYYKTTYMSVLIRCYELEIFDIKDTGLMDALLSHNSEEEQKNLFSKIPGRSGALNIMDATREDDFEVIYEEAERIGTANVDKGLITEDDLEYRLEGMRKAYLFVKGEA